LAASLLISTLQVPDACVPAAPGWDVAAGAVAEVTDMAGVVS
jgi:hypothetical protein